MLPACQQAFIVVKITFQCITKEEKNLNTTIIIVSENKTKQKPQTRARKFTYNKDNRILRMLCKKSQKLNTIWFYLQFAFREFKLKF